MKAVVCTEYGTPEVLRLEEVVTPTPGAEQIARSFGAEVTAVCSTRHLDMARSMGADHVIDDTREDFTTEGLAQ